MKRKYIIGIGILVVLLCLTLVMCSMFHGTDKDYYEGEKVPIKTTEDIFYDEQEYSTSESDVNEISNGESDVNEISNGESETDENILGENSAEGNDANESSNAVSDTKNNQENGNKHMDEGWSPFY